MDLMLALSEDTVHEVDWTDALLDEWERVIVREQRRPSESAARITAAIREFFADSKIHESSYAHLVDDMPSADPDDRHHIAAAVAGNAAVIVTWNSVLRSVIDRVGRAVRHFPSAQNSPS
jgi:predicted nucleic acid-binding protein